MKRPYWKIFFCFLYLWIIKSSEGITGIPTDLRADEITSTSFVINFTEASGSIAHEYELSKLHGNGNTITNYITFSSRIENLEGNTIYIIRLRGIDSNFAKRAYSRKLQVRTHPEPFQVTTTDPTPNSVTVFLPQLPGVSEWSVKYRIKDTTDETVVSTSNKQYYVVNLDDLLANTQYEIWGRASAVNGISLTQTQSAFGSSVVITTAMLSVFGNAEFLAPYTSQHGISNSTEYQDLLNSLKAAYNNTSIVSNVIIIEVENSTTSGNVIVHYELLVTNQNYPSAGSLTLNDSSTFTNSFINSGDTPLQKYVLIDTEDSLSLLQYSVTYLALDATLNPLCFADRSYQAALIATSEVGEKQEIGGAANEASSSSFSFVLGFSRTDLSSNTLYNIDQMHFIRYCLNGTTNVSIYYRSFETTAVNTNPTQVITYEGSFFITTVIDSIRTNGSTFISFENGTGAIVSVPAVKKAVKYILENDRVEVGSISEPNLDSSQFVDITVANLTVGETYNLTLTVVVRAHSGILSNQTSTDTITVKPVLWESHGMGWVPWYGMGLKKVSHGQACESSTINGNNDTCKCETAGENCTIQCSPTPCPSNATCVINVNEFNCTCESSGYIISLNGCVDEDECITNNHNCDSKANCANTIGSFNYTCINGYSGNGTSCDDIDECMDTNNCDVKAYCINTPGSYSCICNTHYKGSCMDVCNCMDDPHPK